MKKVFLLMLLWLFHGLAYAENADSLWQNDQAAEQRQMQYDEAENQPPSIYALLAEMSRNSAQTNQLLEKISSDGCSRQLQIDTIRLVGNMNRNIQIMTNIMVRMGYNIEELSRAPKKMNDLPFMP
jgi:hypothetical protein